MKVFPQILAVFVGVFTGSLLIWFIQTLGQKQYPPPSGFNFEDEVAVAHFIANSPLGSKLFVIVGYAAGAFISGLITQLIGRKGSVIPALLSGVVLLAAGVSTLISIPHPTWLAITCLVVFIPFAYLGARIVRKKPTS